MPTESLQITSSPRTEIEFWARRKEDMTRVYSVFTSQATKQIMNLLQHFRSNYSMTASNMVKTIDNGKSLINPACMLMGG